MAESGAGADELLLNKYVVGSIETIVYIPEFITPEEENLLLHQVNSAPASKWKTLKKRRLQDWGGSISMDGLFPQRLPGWLTTITEKIRSTTGLFPSPINHVLVNEYHPGQGIMPHQDGPTYFPVVAIVSLGAPTMMQFTPHIRLKAEQENPKETTLALMPRSLLIFKDSAYQDYLHGIAEALEYPLDASVSNLHLLEGISETSSPLRQTQARVSLTCRYVPKEYKGIRNLFRS